MAMNRDSGGLGGAIIALPISILFVVFVLEPWAEKRHNIATVSNKIHNIQSNYNKHEVYDFVRKHYDFDLSIIENEEQLLKKLKKDTEK